MVERQEGGEEKRRGEGERPTDGALPDPMGARAVEITERRSERVETNGRGRRRAHEENSCTARNSPSL